MLISSARFVANEFNRVLLSANSVAVPSGFSRMKVFLLEKGEDGRTFEEEDGSTTVRPGDGGDFVFKDLAVQAGVTVAYALPGSAAPEVTYDGTVIARARLGRNPSYVGDQLWTGGIGPPQTRPSYGGGAAAFGSNGQSVEEGVTSPAQPVSSTTYTDSTTGTVVQSGGSDQLYGGGGSVIGSTEYSGKPGFCVLRFYN